jgi:hypothetical protein
VKPENRKKEKRPFQSSNIQKETAFVSSSSCRPKKIALWYVHNSLRVSYVNSITSPLAQGRHSPKPSSTSASALLLQHQDPKAARDDPALPRLFAAPTRVVYWRLRVVRVEVGDVRLLLSVVGASTMTGRPFVGRWCWLLLERR